MVKVYELIDAELDSVCGGGLIGNIVVQPEIATQVGIAIGGFSVFGNGGGANVTQLLGQADFSSIHS